MAGKRIRVLLTREAYKSCFAKPSAKFLSTILSLEKGDLIEVKGEETFYPLERALRTLREAGFRILQEESDGVEYTVIAER
ncbi:MAG: hypothetical protein F7C33_04570 [Desulfurococcales archaeon]|nr:hypothetical protein [Desulfurococcales archaeon]